MVNFVVDTSIFIEYIRRGEILPSLIKWASKGERKLVVPVVVVGELLAGKSMKTEKFRRELVSMFKGMEIVDINVSIAAKYGEIRRKEQAFGNDAWIAASCLVKKAKLATLNKKHFEKVRGLKMYNGKDETL
ncbi:MAG: PIN domain-containing protein [Candidatus Shapirobacteria bacterium]|jgi:predicted nucleic acid-binding protein